MGLPIIKSPKYDLVIPSTKQKVKFRPFLVKEEKVLLMAAESKNQKQVVNALRDVIGACVDFGKDKKVDIMSLPTFDLQYIFLQLRSKSVGEQVELTLQCPSCKGVNKTSVDLSLVEINYPEGHKTEIQLSDEVGVVMRYPTFEMLDSVQSLDTSDISSVIELIVICIDKIYDAENIYTRKEYSNDDFTEFVYSLTQSNLEDMQVFFNTMPNMEHEISFNCEHCDKEEKVILRGIEDFFTSGSHTSP